MALVAAIRCKSGAEQTHKTFTGLYAAIRQPLTSIVESLLMKKKFIEVFVLISSFYIKNPN
ncbi:MAG: hypothetical protein ACR2KX_21330, partial [Chitinophagaceae bacterium]